MANQRHKKGQLQMLPIMMMAQVLSMVLFIWYGITCLFSERMVSEFTRYHLPHLRVLTGTLQLAGGLGIMVGHFYRPILLLSAGGLAAMMFIALLTRFRVRDPLHLAIPSFCLCILNIFIFATAL
jgi:uncharacterized membrane protein YphA (DoxX/SURF4 family)